MADYTVLPSGNIRREIDSAVIPPDPANLDYAAYQVWLEAGHMPDVAWPIGALDPADTLFHGAPLWQF